MHVKKILWGLMLGLSLSLSMVFNEIDWHSMSP
jgi:hypothetical protein